MRYALDKENNKIEVSFSGELAKCGICNSNVKGRKGEQRIKHWYHQKKKTVDCDDWYEPITEWHLKWQNYFPKENREITITNNKVTHRADILLNNGLVIEIQNSPIKFSEIQKRELFYGKKNLIWILNGNNLTKNSILTEDLFTFIKRLTISIPKTFKLIENYNFKDVLNEILENTEIGYLKSDKNRFRIENENTLVFEFLDDKITDFYLTEVHYKYYIACVYEGLYSQIGLDDFRKKIKIEYSSIFEEKRELRLIKKYWKKFIDKMKYPVFIDNLNGMKENELFYYQENRIVDKNKFINYYLKYA